MNKSTLLELSINSLVVKHNLKDKPEELIDLLVTHRNEKVCVNNDLNYPAILVGIDANTPNQLLYWSEYFKRWCVRDTLYPTKNQLEKFYTNEVYSSNHCGVLAWLHEAKKSKRHLGADTENMSLNLKVAGEEVCFTWNPVYGQFFAN